LAKDDNHLAIAGVFITSCDISCHMSWQAILALIKPEILSFDPPTLKTLYYNQTLTHFRDNSYLKFPRWRPEAMLDLVQLETDTIDLASPKKPILQANMKLNGPHIQCSDIVT